VRTKFSKSFVTTFFPVGDDIRTMVADWVAYLRPEKLWGLDDPLFPATKVVVGDNLRFAAAGLDRKHWSSASPIRQIFKEAFARPDFRTSIRTALGRPWRFWGAAFAKHRRNTRPGHKILGMITS